MSRILYEQRNKPGRKRRPKLASGPVSVVAFVTSARQLRLMWQSVSAQTYKDIEFVAVNQARELDSVQAVRDEFDRISASYKGPMTMKHVRNLRRASGVRAASHTAVLLADGWSLFEKGHVESLISTEARTGKRAVSASCVLGEHGGFDTAEIVAGGRLRHGSFLLRKEEAASVLLDMRADNGSSYSVRMETEFLKRYWRKYMAGMSVGTKVPTMVVAAGRV